MKTNTLLPCSSGPFRLWPLIAMIAFALPCRAVTIYSFSLDTTAWSGLNGTLAFDLIGGDAAAANNTASVSALATDGTLSSAVAFALTDVGFFNEELRDITFGTTFSFTLQLTENFTGPGFDQFSFFVLDPNTFLPLAGTTDPTGSDALFAIDITGQAGGSAVSFDALAPGISWEVEPAPTTAVPDHGATLSLLVVTLLGLAGIRRRPSASAIGLAS